MCHAFGALGPNYFLLCVDFRWIKFFALVPGDAHEVLLKSLTPSSNVYADLAGRFPIRSLKGNVAIFVLFDYTANAISVQLIPSVADESMIKAFTTHINYLTAKGFKPVLNVISNIASKVI